MIETFDWNEIEKLDVFDSDAWESKILKGFNSFLIDGDKNDFAKRQHLLAEKIKTYTQHSINRLKNLENKLLELFEGKDELIHMIIVSAIAQQPLLIIGEPGTAKSKIVGKFCEGLGLGRSGDGHQHELFQYLLHSFTEPDEILGPVEISALTNKESPKFKRFREHSITDAEVIFLDEVFKANSAILNSLLTIINERRVYEGGEVNRTDARVIFGASNNIPDERMLRELNAFYERFILRIISYPIAREFIDGKVPDARKELLSKGWKGEVDELRGGYDPGQSALEKISCFNDILFLNRSVTELYGGEDLQAPEMTEFIDLFHRCVLLVINDKLGSIDDRKFIKLLLVTKAHALYTHNGPPDIDDLIILKYVWKDIVTKYALERLVDNFIKENKVRKTAVSSDLFLK